MDISDWRKRIDAVDTAMLHLLNLRAGFALEVGKLKGAEGLSMRTPEREKQIVERMQSLNTGPLDDEAVGQIYETIVNQCIRAQERGRGEVAKK
jgi:chorismate mutase-like protein